MSLSKRLRFEIFRRDGHACLYCGRRAPHVTLEVDHRIPRCMGGSDDPENLISACWDCNRGKGPIQFEGRQPERWELAGYDSWESWMTDMDGQEMPDEFPSWLTGRKCDRKPIVFDFDIYAAAKELCPASLVYADTIDSVIRKAELF